MDPTLSTYDAVAHLSTADEPNLTTALLAVFAKATNMDHRRRVLEVWSEANIADPSERATLIRDVLLPTGQAGVGGLDLVIRHVDLWSDAPHGTKPGRCATLPQSAAADGQQAAAVAVRIEPSGAGSRREAPRRSCSQQVHRRLTQQSGQAGTMTHSTLPSAVCRLHASSAQQSQR